MCPSFKLEYAISSFISAAMARINWKWTRNGEHSQPTLKLMRFKISIRYCLQHRESWTWCKFCTNFRFFSHLKIRQNQYKITLPFRIRWPQPDIARNRDRSPYIKLENTQTVAAARGGLEETRSPPPPFLQGRFSNSSKFEEKS